MLSQLLLQTDHMAGLVPLVVCLACVGLVFFCGQRLMRRPRRPEPPARPKNLLAEGNNIDERVVAAVRHSAVPVLVSDEAAKVEPVRGFVVERSVAGLCLELSEEGQVDPGVLLSVKPAGVSDDFPWVKVQVDRCQALKGCWHLHCRYLRTPPFSVRMLFG